MRLENGTEKNTSINGEYILIEDSGNNSGKNTSINGEYILIGDSENDPGKSTSINGEHILIGDSESGPGKSTSINGRIYPNQRFRKCLLSLPDPALIKGHFFSLTGST